MRAALFACRLYWFERCPSPAPRQSKAILTGLHFHIPYRTMRSRESAHSMAQ